MTFIEEQIAQIHKRNRKETITIVIQLLAASAALIAAGVALGRFI